MNNLILFHDSTGKVDALAPLVNRISPSMQILGIERRFCPVVPQSLAELTTHYLLAGNRGSWVPRSTIK